MVKVGQYWIDRYESSLMDTKGYNSGSCNGSTGKQYGISSDDYPVGFPDSGNWQGGSDVYACSVTGRTPSANMSWFQAQQACLLAGKRLCTNGEWQGAAAGTQDPGKYNGTTGGACNTDGTALRKTGMAGAVPAASSSCISSWGVEDTIGNLREWVDLWGQAGLTWITSNSGTKSTTPWPTDPKAGFGDHNDQVQYVNGYAFGDAGPVKGAPASALRGGHWSDGVHAGVFMFALQKSPASSATSFGVRCCRYW